MATGAGLSVTSNLFGGSPQADLRLRKQLEQGAVPTITVHNATEIENPNAGIQSMFEAARKRIPNKNRINYQFLLTYYTIVMKKNLIFLSLVFLLICGCTFRKINQSGY